MHLPKATLFGALLSTVNGASNTMQERYPEVYPKSALWQGDGEVHTSLLHHSGKTRRLCVLHKIVSRKPYKAKEHGAALSTEGYDTHSFISLTFVDQDPKPMTEEEENGWEMLEHPDPLLEKSNLELYRVSCSARSDYGFWHFKKLRREGNTEHDPTLYLPEKMYDENADCGAIWMDVHKHIYENQKVYRDAKQTHNETGSAVAMLDLMCKTLRKK
ncbi:hypothetical protein FOL46_001559 [Perkinsus olseni]|uniref:Uncharacterized protein n=1 Tax=Perkinsus olseni TaxID=32597 RepID=A0A7J6MCC9_PEROL|nr:hypothetical protein FOL46_001559 [Perkinsus olseni]